MSPLPLVDKFAVSMTVVVKTRRVVFSDNRPPVTVRAEVMHKHDGSIWFTLDGKTVASFPSADVVRVEESP